MVREIQFDEEVLWRAMEANDATDEEKMLENALQVGLRVKAQAGIRKLVGKVEFWDEVIEDRVANSVSQPLNSGK